MVKVNWWTSSGNKCAPHISTVLYSLAKMNAKWSELPPMIRASLLLGIKAMTMSHSLHTKEATAQLQDNDNSDESIYEGIISKD
jgi:hypothetical protein